MRFSLITVLALMMGLSTLATAQDATGSSNEAGTMSSSEEGHGFLMGTLMYLPNRAFDLLDTVRLRARVGLGTSVGARATKVASVTLGAYDSLYVGIPGPRLAPHIPRPVGRERSSGMQVSVVDDRMQSKHWASEPHYGPLEVGAQVHLIAIGANIGIDIGEIGDFAAGFLLIDFKEDDL